LNDFDTNSYLYRLFKVKYYSLENDGFLIREWFGVVRNIALILHMLNAVIHIMDNFSATIDPSSLRRHFRGRVCRQWNGGGAETGPELVS